MIREATALAGHCLRRPAFRWLFLAFLAVAFLATLIEYSIRSARLPARLWQPPAGTPVVTDFRGRAVAVFASPVARESYPLSLRDMGEWLPLATIGIEDTRFWTHPGVDIRAAVGATLRNIRNLRVISGASTITQQLIKISTESDGRSLTGKIREGLAALQLERNWDKKKILEG